MLNVLSLYVQIALSLIAAYGLFAVGRRLLSPSYALKLANLLLLLALLLPSALFTFTHYTDSLSSYDKMLPAVQIWSASSQRVSSPYVPGGAEQVVLHSPLFSFDSSLLSASRVLSALGLLCSILLLCGLLVFARMLWGLMAIRRSLIVIRRIGHVRVCVHEGRGSPYSFWLPSLVAGGAYVAVPESMLPHPEALRAALRHELQHLRQRDTHWSLVLQTLKTAFFWNPIVHVWDRSLQKIQEFACDEVLIRTQKLSPQAYGRCLVLAAQQCLEGPGIHAVPAGTTRMAVSDGAETLKRRIEMIFDYEKSKRSQTHKVFAGTVIAIAALTLGTLAFASQVSVKDQRITEEQAKTMLAKAQSADLPLTLNPAVLKQLNKYLATPDGRKFSKESLERMKQYRPMIEARLKAEGLPLDFVAIPFVESGYRNFKAKVGAGLWMFIPESARAFGLKVDDKNDERLNVELETDAAIKYLKKNKAEFNDWWLAVLAYNAGEKQVAKGLERTGSRDLWKLIGSGFDNDPGYIAMVQAAILILKNPELLN